MRRSLISLIAFILILFTAVFSFATVRWTPEDAARARDSFLPGARGEAPARFSGDNLADFGLAAQFVASMQVSDPLSPDFGGIMEGEHLLDVIQTDNTSESIWFFSRYFELTGDSSLLGNLEASWIYVLNHPAYNEEGGSDNLGGYYRIYNCGWALRAQMKYVEVFGDSSYGEYADSCANYLATHNLIRVGTTGFFNLVNPPVLAWAAGNLYEYGVRAGNATWQETGWGRANRVKNWIDVDPLVLSNEEWAMSGGAVMWGLLESYFREFPGEETAWLADHIAEMDTIADPGSWENAWNGWYALGMKRLEQATGDPVWGARHLWMTDYLRAFDTDDDGGIQAQPADTDTMDQAWVTSYLGFMGIGLLIEPATEVAGGEGTAPGAPLLLPNRPNPFNPVTAISFHLDSPASVRLGVWNPAGRLVSRIADGEMRAGTHSFVWNGTDNEGRALPSGVYFCRIDAGLYSESRKMTLVR